MILRFSDSNSVLQTSIVSFRGNEYDYEKFGYVLMAQYPKAQPGSSPARTREEWCLPSP